MEKSPIEHEVKVVEMESVSIDLVEDQVSSFVNHPRE
jgi:hypothetical protein